MVVGKKVAIFDWDWGGNSAPREWQKMPCLLKQKSIFGERNTVILGNYNL